MHVDRQKSSVSRFWDLLKVLFYECRELKEERVDGRGDSQGGKFGKMKLSPIQGGRTSEVTFDFPQCGV